MIQILYGVSGSTIDVTDICFSQLKQNNIITIPYGDHNRSNLFSDYLTGVEKNVFIIICGNIYKYNKNYIIKIDTINNSINVLTMFKILFGVPGNALDVTDICSSIFKTNDVITIPSDDSVRREYFSDPLVGIVKSIIVVFDDEIYQYGSDCIIKINTKDDINTLSVANTIPSFNVDDSIINNKIANLYSELKMKYGNLDGNKQLPEQKMIVQYLTGKENVLEIGGNIGVKSLIIGSILEKNGSLVTLESDETTANVLLNANRKLNNLTFHIENSALSNKKIIQKNGYTKQSDILEKGYNWVNTITFIDLKSKYNIDFDTLVVSCNGAFYDILLDMPEILNDIKMIIMKNDYDELFKKEYVDEILQENGFTVHCVKPGECTSCPDRSFEVWKTLDFVVQM